MPAACLGIGLERPPATPGTGTVHPQEQQHRDGDQPSFVGSTGTLGGNRHDQRRRSRAHGTIQVGASPDALHLAGGLSQTGGKIVLDVRLRRDMAGS